MPQRKHKRNKLISQCPVCNGELHVTNLRCADCDTELAGDFSPNEFARLPQEKLDFLRTFLACRGNLKEVEAALNISYPTVRSRLDQLLESLALTGGSPRNMPPPDDDDDDNDKEEILAALARGELSVEEAERQLRRG